MSMELGAGLATAVTGPTAAVSSRPVETSEKAAVAVTQTPEEVSLQRKRLEIVNRLVGSNESLMIERDPAGGHGFIYTAVDKVTGEVTRIWPPQDRTAVINQLPDMDTRGAMLNTRV